MNNFLWATLLCNLAFLPIEQPLNWAYHKIKKTKATLDTHKNATYFCKFPVIVLLGKSITLLKSFLIPYALQVITESEIAVLMSILCLIIPPLWMRKNTNHYELALTLWGIFTFISPYLAVIYPLSFLITLLFSQHSQWAILIAAGISGLIIIYSHSFGIEFVTLIAIVSLISLAWWQKSTSLDDSKRYR